MEEECRDKDAADGEKREIGKLAVWSVSSFKPGNGVDLLRDSNVETYWQSDGAQPHLVNIQFQKKVRLQQLAMYVDFKLDESYTPNKVSVRAGNSFHDLREIKLVELAEPIGWVHIPLSPNDSSKEFLRAFLVQIAVLSNHQNGRDTHIRQITIYGPRQVQLSFDGQVDLRDVSSVNFVQKLALDLLLSSTTSECAQSSGRSNDNHLEKDFSADQKDLEKVRSAVTEMLSMYLQITALMQPKNVDPWHCSYNLLIKL